MGTWERALACAGPRGLKSAALQVLLASVSLIACGAGTERAFAQRTINADDYLDKLHGMWFGQLIGNHTGRPFEGQYCTREPAPDEVFEWVIKTSYEDPWTGDDDTNFEYLYLHCLETHGLNPTNAQIQGEWDDHVPLTDIYIANLQAKYLMIHGFVIPDTGAYRNNMNAYAIDSQITTESLGALSPGLRQWAIDAVQTFASVTNEGFSRHAAEFYGALYAVAAFETDIHAVVELGQEAIPQSSRSWQAIQDVRDWYALDLLDGNPDWRETRRLIYDYYCGAYDHGRYRGWIESTINLANTTLALLYGEGDFEETVKIAVLSGFDADCNPATAGGLIGLILGYDALPPALTGPATNHYKVLSRPGLPEYDTITNIAARLQAATEQVIVANGGTVEEAVYTIPADDPVTPEPELPDPPGPTGLVAAVLAAGGSVTTSASIEDHDPMEDRDNLDGIIDGIIDVRYNGHLPYKTDDGDNAQPEGGDYYQLNFSMPVRFDGLTFHEGDIRWYGINYDPREYPPRGGYFENLIVEVRRAGNWTSAANLSLSEPLDRYAFYQVIGLDFDSLSGDAVRIRGEAGGSWEFTSIIEFVADGVRIGDFDDDHDVDLGDFAVFADGMAGPDTPPTPTPPITPEECLESFDTEADGDVDLRDYAVFAEAFTSAPAILN
ncbi:MAG: ADP-ribosylglycohydrolase family protein [Phycisphaerae bacterium]|nr:ADP-ribosylglycohydrolase family protein [Phycisphaerae bacterium]